LQNGRHTLGLKQTGGDAYPADNGNQVQLQNFIFKADLANEEATPQTAAASG
jgi:hypothetical protein